MNAKELAQELNGRDRARQAEISEKEQQLAKEKNLVVVFGASDDLMEFRGAIEDEFDCYNGGTAYINKKGLLENECDDEDCPYFAKKQKQASQIEAVWDEDSDFVWSYRTDIPHETFEIFEEGENYCKGIVFSLDDIK